MKMAEDYFGASELGIFKLKISNNRNLTTVTWLLKGNYEKTCKELTI